MVIYNLNILNYYFMKKHEKSRKQMKGLLCFNIYTS